MCNQGEEARTEHAALRGTAAEGDGEEVRGMILTCWDLIHRHKGVPSPLSITFVDNFCFGLWDQMLCGIQQIIS